MVPAFDVVNATFAEVGGRGFVTEVIKRPFALRQVIPMSNVDIRVL